jgi:hypothetical protein
MPREPAAAAPPRRWLCPRAGRSPRWTRLAAVDAALRNREPRELSARGGSSVDPSVAISGRFVRVPDEYGTREIETGSFAGSFAEKHFRTPRALCPLHDLRAHGQGTSLQA